MEFSISIDRALAAEALVVLLLVVLVVLVVMAVEVVEELLVVEVLVDVEVAGGIVVDAVELTDEEVLETEELVEINVVPVVLFEEEEPMEATATPAIATTTIIATTAPISLPFMDLCLKGGSLYQSFSKSVKIYYYGDSTRFVSKA